MDNYGDKVKCYINNVYLIDMWKDTEEKFHDPRYAENFSEEQIQEMKKRHYEILGQSCPKGSAALLFMRLKPDQETGTHNLTLRGCVIQTAVSPDTSTIPAELFLYLEKEAEWEEKI